MLARYASHPHPIDQDTPAIKLIKNGHVTHIKSHSHSCALITCAFILTELDHHSILPHFRNLLLIFFTLFCWAITIKGNCEDTPANCVWNSQQEMYTCDLIGVPNDIVIRRLPLSHLNIRGSIYSVTTSPEMKDIGISWNKTYVTLFVSMHLCMQGSAYNFL